MKVCSLDFDPALKLLSDGMLGLTVCSYADDGLVSLFASTVNAAACRNGGRAAAAAVAASIV